MLAQVPGSSDQNWDPLVVWALSLTFRGLDQLTSTKTGTVERLIDRLSFVRSFDPTVYHFEVQQAEVEHRQGGCVRN
jgi:hypothetical protein